jgi:hypothetical protein
MTMPAFAGRAPAAAESSLDAISSSGEIFLHSWHLPCSRFDLDAMPAELDEARQEWMR